MFSVTLTVYVRHSCKVVLSSHIELFFICLGSKVCHTANRQMHTCVLCIIVFMHYYDYIMSTHCDTLMQAHTQLHSLSLSLFPVPLPTPPPQSHVHTCMHARARTHTPTHTCMHGHTYTHTHTHARKHKHACTCAHTHTHTQK